MQLLPHQGARENFSWTVRSVGSLTPGPIPNTLLVKVNIRWDSDVISEQFNPPDINISWPIQVWRKFIDKGTRFQLDSCIFSKSPPCQIFHILVVAGALAHLKVTDFCSFFLVVTFFLVVSCCSIYVGLSKPQHCPGSGSDGRLPLAPGILLCNLIEANKYSNYSVQLHR